MNRIAGIAVLVLLQAVLLIPPAGAQVGGEGEPPAPERLDGRLLLVDRPADSGTVVLHAVSPEEAGAIDSVRVDSEGRFSFDLADAPPIGGGQSIFVSHRFDGVLYFGPPLFQPGELQEEYTVRAYPSEPAPVEGMAFEVEIRNLVVEEGPGVWRVTDIIQVHNDHPVTWVSVDGSTPVWRYPLPPGATAFRVMDGGPSPGDVRFEDGTLLAVRPFPPGDRLFVIQYDLETLEMSIPLTGITHGVELLVREPAPPLRVEGMTPTAPVEMERGTSYLRWTGENLEDRVVRTTLGEETELPMAWLGIGVALLLILAGSLLFRRGGGFGAHRRAPGSGPAPVRPDRDPAGPGVGSGPAAPSRGRRREILLALARLQEEEEAGAPTARAESDRASRRRELLDELAAIEGRRPAGGGGERGG